MEELKQLAVEEIVAVVQRVNNSAIITEEKPAKDQHKTWHQKTSTDLAQDAHQTDPAPNMGGQDHGLQEGVQGPGLQVGGPNQCAYNWGNQILTPAAQGCIKFTHR